MPYQLPTDSSPPDPEFYPRPGAGAPPRVDDRNFLSRAFGYTPYGALGNAIRQMAHGALERRRTEQNQIGSGGRPTGGNPNQSRRARAHNDWGLDPFSHAGEDPPNNYGNWQNLWQDPAYWQDSDPAFAGANVTGSPGSYSGNLPPPDRPPIGSGDINPDWQDPFGGALAGGDPGNNGFAGAEAGGDPGSGAGPTVEINPSDPFGGALAGGNPGSSLPQDPNTSPEQGGGGPLPPYYPPTYSWTEHDPGYIGYGQSAGSREDVAAMMDAANAGTPNNNSGTSDEGHTSYALRLGQRTWEMNPETGRIEQTGPIWNGASTRGSSFASSLTPAQSALARSLLQLNLMGGGGNNQTPQLLQQQPSPAPDPRSAPALLGTGIDWGGGR